MCTHSFTTEYEPAPNVLPTLYRHGCIWGVWGAAAWAGAVVAMVELPISSQRVEVGKGAWGRAMRLMMESWSGSCSAPAPRSQSSSSLRRPSIERFRCRGSQLARGYKHNENGIRLGRGSRCLFVSGCQAVWLSGRPRNVWCGVFLFQRQEIEQKLTSQGQGSLAPEA